MQSGRFRRRGNPWWRVLVLGTIVLLTMPAALGAQALHMEQLANGSWLLMVAQPLADATTVAWPEITGAAEPEVRSVSSGQLTLAAELEAAFSESPSLAPPVIIAVGVASRSELIPLLTRTLRAAPAAWSAPSRPPLVEGGVERRLGAAGDPATLRLSVPLPPPADPRRAAVEVLWELIPELLAVGNSSLRVRFEGEMAALETRVDPQLAEIRLRELRLDMARLAAEPMLSAAPVDEAATRVLVRRLGQLEEHPEGALHLVKLWLMGGSEAVLQELFGLRGVTVEMVREAALSWLPQHPGQAVLILPPQVFNPRFASFPESLRLDNDLAVTILERPAAELAALCLRPVILPDVDGEISATVLARLATEIRGGAAVPGWVRVRTKPPLLELAAPPDAFAELGEVLQRALAVVGADELPASALGGGDARRRALSLMGQELGLGEVVRPSELLRPSNLALGAVAPDAEAATEALRKFGVGGETASSVPASSSLSHGARSRVAAPGGRSVVVTALELELPVTPSSVAVLAALIGQRAERLEASLEVEMLRPLVPGREVVLLIASAETDIPAVEARVAEIWSELVAAAREEELAAVRRNVATRYSSDGSGSLGRARRCAAVAAGAATWRPSTAAELEILGVGEAEMNDLLAAVADFQALRRTGAGVLPVQRMED